MGKGGARMARIIGIVPIVISVAATALAVWMANRTIETPFIPSGPDQFESYQVSFKSDWELYAIDAALFVVGLLFVLKRKKPTQSWPGKGRTR
jgi:hypothetical protein